MGRPDLLGDGERGWGWTGLLGFDIEIELIFIE
jgi:hypothetical protein